MIDFLLFDGLNLGKYSLPYLRSFTSSTLDQHRLAVDVRSETRPNYSEDVVDSGMWVEDECLLTAGDRSGAIISCQRTRTFLSLRMNLTSLEEASPAVRLCASKGIYLLLYESHA